MPRTMWMMAGLFGPVGYALTKGRARIHKPLEIAKYLVLGGFLAPLVVAVHSRVYEGRFVESNPLIDSLSHKYNFGIYDFAVAKKESHIQQLMYTMDSPYDSLHS